jgi:hypothetical protein
MDLRLYFGAVVLFKIRFMKPFIKHLFLVFAISTAVLHAQGQTMGSYAPGNITNTGDNAIFASIPFTSGISKSVAYTSSEFKGTLHVTPQGLVRVTNARPAGTYTITVRGFSGFLNSQSITRTFVLTVGEAACTQGQLYV